MRSLEREPRGVSKRITDAILRCRLNAPKLWRSNVTGSRDRRESERRRWLTRSPQIAPLTCGATPRAPRLDSNLYVTFALDHSAAVNDEEAFTMQIDPFMADALPNPNGERYLCRLTLAFPSRPSFPSCDFGCRLTPWYTISALRSKYCVDSQVTIGHIASNWYELVATPTLTQHA